MTKSPLDWNHKTATLTLLPMLMLLGAYPASAGPNYPPLTCPAKHVLVLFYSGSVQASDYAAAQSAAYDICAAKIPQSSFQNHWKNAQQAYVGKSPRGSYGFVCFGCAPYFEYTVSGRGESYVAVRSDAFSLNLPELGTWSKWLDRDTPGGKGDYETLSSLLKEGQLPCSKPSAIECQAADGRDHTETKQVVSCNLSDGAVCINDQQAGNERCLNYRIRVRCE